jgi:N-acetyl-gamma-glutamyl-phosphate reductase
MLNVAILGASGYTGAELLRLLHGHPHVRVTALSAESQAGQSLHETFPHLGQLPDQTLVKIDDIDFTAIDLVFCCLPHGTTQTVLNALPAHVRIIDLSADFRLRDPALYAEWYGHAHQALALQKEAVYGLSEHARASVASARLIANPGCYPTASLLPLLPLINDKLLSLHGIVIDAKSGISGAGRSVKRNLLFTELDEGMSAYSVGRHRHRPEIEQELSDAAGQEVQVNFTPHLIPMKRGMIATTYAMLVQGKNLQDAQTSLLNVYRDEPFVELLSGQNFPATHAVRASNRCQIGVYPGRGPQDIILVSAIDNLVKGASGQAVQNMNVMYGWPETLALDALPVYP